MKNKEVCRVLVLLESPYAGISDDKELYHKQVEYHLRYARACMRDCLTRGEMPFASHLLYTQDGILDDTLPEERRLGMEAGFAWGQHAEKTVVYLDLGKSNGMQEGVLRAKAAGRPVEERRLKGNWAADFIKL